MSRAPEPHAPKHPAGDVPPALAEYADRLLLGTGLDAIDALRIASGELDPPSPLKGLAEALRTGWQQEEDLA
jgi:hypothetical protein